MTLPSLPPEHDGQEYLRVGGGYNSAALGQSPSGGLNVDNAGNMATNGDLTVDGDVNAGGGFGSGGVTLGEAGLQSEEVLVVDNGQGSHSVGFYGAGGGGFSTVKAFSGSTVFDISAQVNDGVSDGRIRFFRNTSTTGVRAVQILKGDGTATATLVIMADRGIIDFLGTMGNSTKDPTVDAPVDWVEVQIGGVTRYIPAYGA